MPSFSRCTMIHCAITAGSLPIVKLLHQYGASLTKRFVGVTPLELAKQLKKQEIVDYIETNVSHEYLTTFSIFGTKNNTVLLRQGNSDLLPISLLK